MSLQKHQQQDESIIQEIADKLGPDQDIFQGNSNQHISAQLQKGIKFRKKCCNNSYRLRQDFLEQLVDDYIDGDTTKVKSKVVKSIKDKESKIRTYNIMRRYLKPNDQSGLTQLDIPEWNKFEFILILSITQLFLRTPPQTQWWQIITCITFFLHMVNWNSTSLTRLATGK
eukprot:13595407-Ditylum_brightwellii.AAC.1